MLTTVSHFGGNVAGWSIEQTGNLVSELGTVVRILGHMSLLGCSVGTAIYLRHEPVEDQERSLKSFIWKFFDLPQLLSLGVVAAGSTAEYTGSKVHALGSCLRDPKRSVLNGC